jgi:hypothetical protein
MKAKFHGLFLFVGSLLLLATSPMILPAFQVSALATEEAESTASADTDAIKAQMSIIFRNFGQLNKLIRLPMTPENCSQGAQLAREMGSAFAAILNLTPQMLADLPIEEQLAARIEYRELVAASLTKSVALERAFSLNEGQGVIQILRELNELQREGHSRFKP